MTEQPPGWSKTMRDLFAERCATAQPVGPPETEWAIEYERSLLPEGTRFPRVGDVYEARADVPVSCVTHWRAAFTGGGDGILPRGTRIRITYAHGAEPIAAYAAPVDDPTLEDKLVPSNERSDPKYAGYSLVMRTASLNTDFCLL